MLWRTTQIGLVGSAALLVTTAFAGPGCIQDLNGDGIVGGSDLGIMFGCYGLSGPTLCDLNGDELSNQQDWGILVLARFGSACDIATFGPGNVTCELSRVENSGVRLGDDTAEPLFDGGVTHWTYQVTVNADGGNGWTTSEVDVQVGVASGLEVFQHSEGGNIEPVSGTITAFPAVAFDTYIGSPNQPANFGSSESSLAYSALVIDDTLWSTGLFTAPNTRSFGLLRVTIIDTLTPLPPSPHRKLAIIPTGNCPAALVLGSVIISNTHGLTEDQLHTTVYDIIENPIVGDINGDLVVDTADLGILLGKFGMDHSYSNLNYPADNIIDTADLGILLGHFGESCP